MPASLDALPPELHTALQAELQPGETLLWSAEPTARELRRQSWGLALVGFCFTAFSVFWVVATLRQASRYTDVHRGIPWDLVGFVCGGLPFLGIGLLMLTSPLWRRGRPIRIAYAVTDRRAIVIEGEVLTARIAVRSFLPQQIKQLQVIDRQPGTGDVVLDRIPVQMGKAQVPRPVGFFGIADPREVEALIRVRLLAHSA